MQRFSLSSTVLCPVCLSRFLSFSLQLVHSQLTLPHVDSRLNGLSTRAPTRTLSVLTHALSCTTTTTFTPVTMRLSLSPTLPSNNAPSNKSSSSSSSSSPPHLTITLLPILALLTTAALAPVAAVAGAVAEGRDGANLATASDGLIRIPLVHTNQHSQAILHERHHHKKRRAHGSPDSASPASYSSKRDHAGRRRAAIDVGVEAAGVQVEIQPTNLKRPMRLKIADLARLRDIQERVSFKYAAADTATAASTNRIKRSNGSPSSASHTKRDIQARQEQQEPGSGQAQSIGDSDAAYTRTTLSKGDAAQPRPSLQAQASNVEITPYVNGREDIDVSGKRRVTRG